MNKSLFSLYLYKFLAAFAITAMVFGVLPISSAQAADTGLQNPTLNAATTGGDGNGFEVNPTNAYADGGGFASNINGTGDRHIYSGYDLSAIPAGDTIDGIEVRLDWWLDTTTGVNSMSVELSWDGGSSWTTAQTATNESTSSANTITLGSSTNDWGHTWTASELSSANFMVRITSNCGASFSCGSRDFFLDWAAVRVYSHVPVVYTITASAGAGGSISPSGAVPANDGTNPLFSSTPNTTYILSDVLVDGGSVGRINGYTFNNIQANHTIAASFDGGWTQPSTNGGGGWTNEGNGYVSDDIYTIADSSADEVVYCGFGLSIPVGQTIDGIEIAVEGYATGSREIDVDLSWNGGANFTGGNPDTTFGGSETTDVLGSATDTWGRFWSESDFSNTNFCVELDATGGSGNVYVDQIQVKVTYHPSVFYTITSSAGAGGTITPLGAVSVQDTSNPSFDSTPDATYILSDVQVDGGSVGAANVYTFTNVLADHTISSSFNGGWTAPSANGGGGWDNEDNFYVSDNNHALANSFFDQVDLSGYNFIPAIPNGETIEGIEIAIEGYATGPRELSISLSWDGGTTFTSANTSSITDGGTDTTYILGGQADTWGRTWTPSEFSNLVIRLNTTLDFTFSSIYIDQIQVKVYYDSEPPYVLFNTDTVPAQGASLATGPTQITVAFSEDVKNDGLAGAANNTANYLLVEAGVNTTFDTISCAPPGLLIDDTQITVNTASYDNNSGSGPFVATLTINGGVALPAGSYRLFVCGTTSIEDLVGNELNGGQTDTTIDFTVIQISTRLPATGFPQGQVTSLSAQPAELAYASYTDLWLEIPKLGVQTSIVGVPATADGWNVNWLGNDAGWLNGSAFPTWDGNSVITAHVWDALNKPGPFAGLKNLIYGDQIKVHAFGQVFTYEIRESKSILPASSSSVFKHEDKSWITLVTCEGYKSASGEYSYRRMVRAVLISVTSE